MQNLHAPQNIPSKLPEDFDYGSYLELNPDLVEKGIDTKELAILHYLTYGKQENRTYKKIFSIDSKDTDFDPFFYLTEYPDVMSYYQGATHISLNEKLFHHYIHHGRNEGRFKNSKEQINSFISVSNFVEDNLTSQIDNLICPTNNLECVCLLTTSKEIANKQYSKFISHLIEMTQKNEISKNINFYIVINKKVPNNQIIGLNKLIKIFKNVEIINLEIPSSEDIYIAKCENQPLPKYGLKSGPNISFIQTIKRLSKYNTSLLLETDCMLGEDWLSRINSYVKYANGFLVSGGIYDGKVFAKSSSVMMNHINGGTALYATSHPILQKLIYHLDIFLPKQVAHSMPGLAYDYALKLLIDNKLDATYNNLKSREIWQFISRNYLPCKLIVNCSTHLDFDLDSVLLMKKHNYAILHKK